jgi:hypothetical protein
MEKKKKKSMKCTLLLVLLLTVIGCDSIYPIGRLRVLKPGKMKPNDTVQIEILYPNTGGTIVEDWKDHCTEIISGVILSLWRG